MNNEIREKLYGIVTQVYLNGESELSKNKRMKLTHIQRVEQMALSLADKVDVEVNKDILSYGAIMHDVAKFIDAPRHNELGAIITKFLLKDMFDSKTLDEISSLIIMHNCKDKGRTDLSIEQQLLIDADILDKLSPVKLVDIIRTATSEELMLEEFSKIMEKANERKECLCTDIGKKYFNDLYHRINHSLDVYKKLQ